MEAAQASAEHTLAVKLRAGTSGYSYKEWKGTFYPAGLPPAKMLAHYASRLRTVEINNTFYRLPRRSALETWAAQVPAEFRFVLKASRRITHFKRLKDTGEETAYLLETALGGLGAKAGVILYQLPPNFKKDLDRLEEFLASLSARDRAAFEFRHASWFEREVFDCLERHGAALCAAETDVTPAPDRISTARWGYIRLRKSVYTEEEIREWVARIKDQGWDEAYVFFMHDEAAAAPALAARFQEMAER